MEKKYKIKFYKNSSNKEEPVLNYIKSLDTKSRLKISKYIEFLKNSSGYIDEPYSKHIIDKIRELRVDFFHNHHRIFYFTFINKTIILLHAFSKNTDKTPNKEIAKALNNYQDVINNPNLYE